MNVLISRATTPPTQSSVPGPSFWQIDFVRTAARKKEPLMGWLSSKDPLSALKGRLRFPTLEQAQAFAAAQGWSAQIAPEQPRKRVPKSYVDNFKPDRRSPTRKG